MPEGPRVVAATAVAPRLVVSVGKEMIGTSLNQIRLVALLFLYAFTGLGGWLQAVELPPGFLAETLATNLNAATAIAPAPDGRIFIADQTGRVLIWKEGHVLDPPALTLPVTDYWERGLIGLELDPNFPRVGHLYLLYVTDKPFVHHVLSRFTVVGDRVDSASEIVLLEGDDQATLGGSVPAGHQGGMLRFDAEGKLFVSIGEQTAGEPAQRLDTFQGKILRLTRDGSVPSDNPFLMEAAGKYRAIYALGVRNSFGIATQPMAEGGRMFFTDVGGSAFEEVNELKPGANYGWPRAEGVSTNAAFTNPIHTYPPMIGQSIVGGVFLSRASLWPEKWRGRFFFADFMKHWIKALDPDAPTNVLNFARGLHGPVATELAPDGSLLVLNRGAVWRDPKRFVANAGSLVRIRYVGGMTLPSATAKPHSERSKFTPALGLPAEADQLPRTMTRADWEGRLEGVKRWPFWLNTRAWQPFARERTSLYLPKSGRAVLAETSQELVLPPGAVVVREFGVSNSRPPSQRTGGKPDEAVLRQLETRLLVVGAPRGYGASYRWKTPEQAELVEDGALDLISDVLDIDSTNVAQRSVTLPWWFPGVDDVVTFPILNPAYWVSTATEDFIFPASPRHPRGPDFKPNWLRAMQRVGVLETALSVEQVEALPSGSGWHVPLESPERRVRSYLHGNCAVCHQPGGASRGNLDLRLATPLESTGLLNGIPVAGDFGVAGARILLPGSPDESILLRRLKDTGFFRMPPTAYHNQTSPIVPVVEQWVRSMTNHTYPR